MDSTPFEFVLDFSADYGTTDAVHDFSPLLRVYKDGRVERLLGECVVAASVDPLTGVQSKDVEISPETGLSARLYIPKTTTGSGPVQKLPLVVYLHGGGFVIESAFSPAYHNYLNLLVAEANVVAVSVNYRRAPEYPLPIAYDDSWAAFEWVASHSNGGGDGEEAWLKDHVDFHRVFLVGDSAGANIVHNLAMRVGSENWDGVGIVGSVLIHPYFWGEKPIGGEAIDVDKRRFLAGLWQFANPLTSGSDDPLMNPALDPKLKSMGCKRVLICVAERDKLRDRGCYYHEVLGESGWGGKVEIMEAKGEGHAFHLFYPNSENAVAMLKKVASFLNLVDKA